MEFDYKRLNPDKIQVGDKVGVLQVVTVGWRGHYRHMYAKPEVIKRITPKRTKFCTESGQEYSEDTTFVAMDAYAVSVIIKSRNPLTLVRGGMRPFINI